MDRVERKGGEDEKRGKGKGGRREEGKRVEKWWKGVECVEGW